MYFLPIDEDEIIDASDNRLSWLDDGNSRLSRLNENDRFSFLDVIDIFLWLDDSYWTRG